MSFQPLWEIAALQADAPAGEVLGFPESEELAQVAPLELVPQAEPEPEPDSDELLARLEEAQEAGRTEGQAQAREELAEEAQVLRTRLSELEQCLAGLELVRAEQAEQSAEQAVSIAVALSRRVLGDTLIHTPRALESLVLSTLSRFPSGGRVRVRVPQDRVEGLQELLAAQEVEVLGDSEMEGGCRVERDGCEVDASLQSLLSELDAALEAP
ncbi:MAG: flagellar biosynthesis/type III secretory pathway protein FliH [Cognaticolwellia sp.]|jgi:flagellar biosynthesis/type III secretory pathway protein FliH